jgi:hypothetical protein
VYQQDVISTDFVDQQGALVVQVQLYQPQLSPGGLDIQVQGTSHNYPLELYQPQLRRGGLVIH